MASWLAWQVAFPFFSFPFILFLSNPKNYKAANANAANISITIKHKKYYNLFI
jgi:hypothetical protein